MRSAISALAMVFLTQFCVLPGQAQRIESIVGATPGPASSTGAPRVQTGTITWLDSATMNFVVQDNAMAQDYWVSRSTRFATQGPRGSFFDLAPGQMVSVWSHGAGPIQTADVIVYQP